MVDKLCDFTAKVFLAFICISLLVIIGVISAGAGIFVHNIMLGLFS